MSPATGAELHGRRGELLHVHCADLPAVLAAAQQGRPDLPDPEHAALCDRYAPGRRRVQAQASRLLSRAVLGRSAGRPEQQYGPQRQQRPGRQPWFGVSHDSGLLALVLGAGPCGIDVEDAGEDLLREIAYRFCGDADAALLAERDGARRLWAAKESVAKALGQGLRAGLRTIHFTGHPGREWAGVTWRGRAVGLRTRTVDLGGRQLAVTASGTPAAVRVGWWAPHRTGADGRWDLRPHPVRPAPAP